MTVHAIYRGSGGPLCKADEGDLSFRVSRENLLPTLTLMRRLHRACPECRRILERVKEVKP